MPLTSLPSAATYKIPDSLTQSSGIITAVINGVTYNLTLPALTAFQLYFLYLLNGSLVQSTTVPSTYRNSNVGALLVGAYYANGLSSVGFGAFCTIEGAPESDTFGLDPTGGMTSVSYTGKMKRKGEWAQLEVLLILTGGAAGTPSFNIPSQLPWDTNKIANSGNTMYPHYGVAGGRDAAGSVSYNLQIIQTNFGACLWTVQTNLLGRQDSVSNGTPFSWTNNASYQAIITYPVTGWSKTPLKDL